MSHVRKMFPGAVTYQGFFSYYNYIIEPNAQHIYVIKGGPGVGKSTFMKKIGDAMQQFGYDLEYHCCSSDNNSIDGLVIPKLGVALLDGTAPHIVDPKNPGAVDEIINLGEYWNEDMMRKSKQEIMDSNYQISRYFKSAYFALSEAKIALVEWGFYTEACQNWSVIDQMLLRVERELFKMTPVGHGEERHLFAWAHTPQGKTQFIDSLLNGISTLYTLQGDPGSGKSTFLSQIAARAHAYGLFVEIYHNTLDPTQIDLVIIPEIETALVITSEPYSYSPAFKGKITELDFNQSLNQTLLGRYEEDIDDCRRRVNQHIQRALKNSKQAKQVHDLMETYYIPAMDFAAIDQKRISVLQQILSMPEQAIAVTKITGNQV
ncbi:PRK06851 family protein [Paradesulfitobacterium ferrireducens]|uniref:PRK06851 family protein n=1 Tax=Paradesulfitobacterium ferrireducens TaxID=2816476 RepID=UPI001A8C1633|nr:PRK06851 family protein [Paradesulfitobacterium ferrireducens]